MDGTYRPQTIRVHVGLRSILLLSGRIIDILCHIWTLTVYWANLLVRSTGIWMPGSLNLRLLLSSDLLGSELIQVIINKTTVVYKGVSWWLWWFRFYWGWLLLLIYYTFVWTTLVLIMNLTPTLQLHIDVRWRDRTTYIWLFSWETH